MIPKQLMDAMRALRDDKPMAFDALKQAIDDHVDAYVRAALNAHRDATEAEIVALVGKISEWGHVRSGDAPDPSGLNSIEEDLRALVSATNAKTDPHEFAAQQFERMSRDYPGKAWLQNDLEERARLLRAARVSGTTCQTQSQGAQHMGRVTETEGPSSGSTRLGGISGGPEIGRIPLPDYIRMVHPGCILVSRRSLLWMLFSLFVAGLCCGMVLGKLLA